MNQRYAVMFIILAFVSGCSSSLDAKPLQAHDAGAADSESCTVQSEFDAATFTQHTESFVKPADVGSCWIIKPLENTLAQDSINIKHFWTGQYSVPFEEGELMSFGQAFYTKGTETIESIPTTFYVYEFSTSDIADRYFKLLQESYERSTSEADYLVVKEAPPNCFSYKTLINIATICKKDKKLLALNIQTVNLIYHKLKLNAASSEEASKRVDEIEEHEQQVAHDSFMRALNVIVS